MRTLQKDEILYSLIPYCYGYLQKTL